MLVTMFCRLCISITARLITVTDIIIIITVIIEMLLTVAVINITVQLQVRTLL